MKHAPIFRIALWDLAPSATAHPPPTMGRRWNSAAAEVYTLPASVGHDVGACLRWLAPQAVMMRCGENGAGMPGRSRLAALKRRLPLTWLVLGVVPDVPWAQRLVEDGELDAVASTTAAWTALARVLCEGRPVSDLPGLHTRSTTRAKAVARASRLSRGHEARAAWGGP